MPLVVCQQPVVEIFMCLEIVQHHRNVAEYRLCGILLVGNARDGFGKKPSI